MTEFFLLMDGLRPLSTWFPSEDQLLSPINSPDHAENLPTVPDFNPDPVMIALEAAGLSGLLDFELDNVNKAKLPFTKPILTCFVLTVLHHLPQTPALPATPVLSASLVPPETLTSIRLT